MYFRPIRLFKYAIIVFCLIIFVYQAFQFLRSRRTKLRLPPSSSSSLSSSSSSAVELQNETKKRLFDQSKDYDEIVETLDPFYIRLPNFFDDEARQWFFNSSYFLYHSSQCPKGICDERGIRFAQPRDHLTIKLSAVRQGLYQNDDCGYNYGDDNARRQFQTSDHLPTIYDEAILYPVPDGWSFQHFLDGIGPKLSHSHSYLTAYPKAKVIILRGARFDRSVKEIWEMLGLSLSLLLCHSSHFVRLFVVGVEESSRIVFISGFEKVGARLLINPCRTPGIHPRLWHQARLMYWSISGLLANRPDPSLRKNFIYIQRTSSNAMNGARLVLNEEAFVALLKEFCRKNSLNYVQYDHSKDPEHIRSRMTLFYNSQFIIGVHSGALSNMNFAQAGTTLIEIMPFRAETRSLPMTCSMFRVEDLKACAGYILYTQSQLLNQTYWILPSVVNGEGNMNLDLNRVEKLLEKLSFK